MERPADVLAIVSRIASRGYAVVRNALPPPIIAGLGARARALSAEGAFAPARIGRGDARNDTLVRGDRIAWLDDVARSPAETTALAWLASLRHCCNSELLLGLVEFEAHYAIFPPGAAYERHRDRFRDDDTRVLSVVLYLNEAWHRQEGGVLRLYMLDGSAHDVVPQAGTFVAFLSDTFDHEVLPATRERLALTGWFRRRALQAR
jgi:SM-20-related protein